MNPITEEKNLIQKAERLGTGANIHDARQVISLYQNVIAGFNRALDRGDEKEEMEDRRRFYLKVRNRLVRFIANGGVDKQLESVTLSDNAKRFYDITRRCLEEGNDPTLLSKAMTVADSRNKKQYASREDLAAIIVNLLFDIETSGFLAGRR